VSRSINSKLSRLTQVELREAWTSESGDFTPWLAQPENLELLAETLGLALELEAQEKDVGPFRADVLCKEIGTDHWVLIENQLERTDHTHLGQLITYAAGLKAVTIVWISSQFTEQHRAALDWLNEITGGHFNFFGVEVELWQIGDSPIAPKFNVVCKPNDWSKRVTEGAEGELSELKQLRLQFWTEFRDLAVKRSKLIKPRKPTPHYWMNFALGRSGFWLTAIASTFDSVSKTSDVHELRVGLVIDNDKSKRYFEMLSAMKPRVEKQLGEELIWHSEEGTRKCDIYARHSADLEDRSRWPEYHNWLLTKLDTFHRTLAPIVTNLNADEPAAIVAPAP